MAGNIIPFPGTADFGAAFDGATMDAMEKSAQSNERGQQRRCALVALACDGAALRRMAQESLDDFKEFAEAVRAFKVFTAAQLDLANAACARVDLVALQRPAVAESASIPAKANARGSGNRPESTLDVSHLEIHAESAIALLQLLIQQVPVSFPTESSEDVIITKACALAGAAIKTLQDACGSGSVGHYLAAGAKVQELLSHIEENFGLGQTDEGAAVCFGLTWAIEAFLQAKGFLAAEAC